MKIMANDLSRQFYRYQNEYEDTALRVLRSGQYILGEEVAAFEDELAQYFSANYCVGVGSGLDALWLSLKVLGIGQGDEVIVPANTYIASVMGITINGATPIFVEPDEYFNIDTEKIEMEITPRTKAVLSVNLYGQACNMQGLRALCEKHTLYLVEDSAQAHGARYQGQYTNQFTHITCFSLYPSKNLGGFGDGGAIITNDKNVAEKLKIYRNYGSEKKYHNMLVGTNSRLDEMQAALLRVKLKHLEELNAERRAICSRYLKEIQNPAIALPKIRDGCETVWHQFVIRAKKRDALVVYLKEREIGTIIHYPIPPHLSEAYAYLGHKESAFPFAEQYANEVLSLPLYNGMTNEETRYVIQTINAFS
jgi:dTDP-4-amino-4,6-dideoxygalactose transaminase